MKTLLLAAAIACAPAALLAADMSGAWTINAAFDSMGIKYTVTCQLKDDGTGKLSGPSQQPGPIFALASGNLGRFAGQGLR